MARVLDNEPVVIDDDLRSNAKDEENMMPIGNARETPELNLKEERRFYNRKRQIEEDEALARRLQRESDHQVIDVDDNDSDVEGYSRPNNFATHFPPAKRRVEEWPQTNLPSLPNLSTLSSLPSSSLPALPTLHPPLVPSVSPCSVFLPTEHFSTANHSSFPLNTASTSIPSTTTTTTTSTSLFPPTLNTFPALPSLSSISVSIQALAPSLAPAPGQTQSSRIISSSHPHSHSHLHVHLHPRSLASSTRLPSFHEFELQERAEQMVEAANSAKHRLMKLLSDLEYRKTDTQPRPFAASTSSSISSPSAPPPPFPNPTLPPLPLFPSIIPHSAAFVPSPSLFHAHVHSHAQAHAQSQLPHQHHSAPFMPSHSTHQSIYPHSHHFPPVHYSAPMASHLRSLHGNAAGPLSHITTFEIFCPRYTSPGENQDDEYDDIEGTDSASDVGEDDDEDDFFLGNDHAPYHLYRGADAKTILTLPVSSYEVKDANNVDICSICIEEFSQGNPVKRLPRCTHVFHPACIDRWLAINKICPTCRTELV
eukprot:TRINITY_DN2531_c0_g1_i4.p1 TRINITY_DN2531_c0_g1~~TRINITY_DN2531_c0_g1_i4.p1  ORF type:complete len:537 (-),score=76.42 TRINITY_DN2531_c0_g1_i4:235-1845(-)